MFKYIIKRILTAIGVLFGVSIIIFALIHMQPGNPYSTMMDPSVPPEVVENMLKNLGYYDPIYIQYFKWLGRALHGDLGYSIYYSQPVLSVIGSRIWNTVLLSGVSLVISIFLGVLCGIISAVKKHSIFDYLTTILAFIGISIPSFFFGLLLIKWFAVDLKILPVSGMKTVGSTYTGMKNALDVAKHIVLPATVLALMQTASFMRYTRSSMLDVLNKEYIRTVRAKGLSMRKTVFKHGFKNALIPIITIICLQIPFLFSGALITETIFVWPGIGRLNYDAVLNRDYPLLMGILMIISVVILFSNLLADVLYAVIDPRIRYK